MLEFKIPEVGENISTGTIVSIAVSIGDTVSVDQDLMELETDKATIPVPSPVDGVIKEILVNEGDEINIGQVVMKISPTQQSETVGRSSDSQPLVETSGKPHDAPTAAPAPASTSPLQTAVNTVTNFIKRLPNEDIPPQGDVPAPPSVRRLARELGLEVSTVPGTGPGGRVSKDDVKTFAKGIILNGGRGATPASPEVRPLPDFNKFGDVKREAMNNIRKTTAKHLSYCWQTIPHVTQFAKADITDLDQLRRDKSTDERKLTITIFLLKIMAEALKEFPQFNTSIDMETKEVIYKNYINLGVAVDTERGLLVPVLRDVDKKNVYDLADELDEMAKRARNKKTSLDELQGGSMTLTNLGGIGGTSFTPIINWPEVAILGVSRGGFEPVYDKKSGEFTPRFFLPLALSYDHRIIDGADGARFIKYVCQSLEKPTQFE